ncbi:hypothetical protein IAQ61_000126 [Plenodomus lingam]|uniref:uncharacterized protein n=1 Tax=Leptosphaeria maculans TaxID=5022 RepID=UPI00332DC4B5|nr:hypothetical protein IAQ61_000126 [Plenodomus lingam]
MPLFFSVCPMCSRSNAYQPCILWYGGSQLVCIWEFMLVYGTTSCRTRRTAVESSGRFATEAASWSTKAVRRKIITLRISISIKRDRDGRTEPVRGRRCHRARAPYCAAYVRLTF